MIKTDPVHCTVKWEIKGRKRVKSGWKGKESEKEGGQRNQNRATRARACWEDNLHFQLSLSHAGRETDVCRRAGKKLGEEGSVVFNLAE